MRSHQLDESDKEEDVHLWVNDRPGPAGRIAFVHKYRVLAEVVLPPQQMRIVRILAETAIDAGPEEFVSTSFLARKLYSAELSVNDVPEVTIKAVNRLRDRLKPVLAAVFPKPKRNAPPRQLVESTRFLGYRLAFPADRIHVRTASDDPPPLVPQSVTPPPHFPQTGELKRNQDVFPKRSEGM